MWSPGHFSHCFNLHNTSLSVPLSHLCSTYYTFTVPFRAHLTEIEILLFISRDGLFILIRTPPLRFDSGIVWAGPGEPAPRPPTALRGLCCLSYAHWHHSSSSPSPRPLQRHEKTTTWHGPSLSLTHTHTATLTHCPLCAAELNNCGWLVSLELDLVYIEPIKTHYSNSE